MHQSESTPLLEPTDALADAVQARSSFISALRAVEGSIDPEEGHENDQADNMPSADDVDDAQEDELSPEETAILILMKRLRFLFGLITLPIVPLGMLAALSLGWFLLTAFVLENEIFWRRLFHLDDDNTTPASQERVCSHPLRAYAWVSLALALYMPYHGKIRELAGRMAPLPSHSRPTTLLSPRRVDQIFHTIALVYVYAGMTLLQTCRDDVNEKSEPADGEPSVNSCLATCPRTTRSFALFVQMLALFTLAVMLPLLCLPCIYVWFLRQATLVVSSSASSPDALATLQRRLRNEQILVDDNDDDDNESNTSAAMLLGGLVSSSWQRRRPTASQVLHQLRTVFLLRQDDGKLLVIPAATMNADGDTNEHVDSVAENTPPQRQLEYGPSLVECCICMSAFYVQNDNHSNDLEEGSSSNHSASEESLSSAVIVQTVACGHLFHERCITNWIVGGSSGTSDGRLASTDMPLRRSRSNDDEISNIAMRHDTNHTDRVVDEGATVVSLQSASQNDHNDRSVASGTRRRHRRAKRTTCPLCRTELLPSSSGTSTSTNTNPTTSRYNTFGV